MKKLNYLGIGPKVAIFFLPWVTVTVLFSLKTNNFTYTQENHNAIFLTGMILMLIGLIIYFSTAKLLLKGIKESRLLTTGAYRYCQNPLYSSIIILIVPALSLLLNSWLILTSSISGYILFRIFIKSEYAEMEKYFGEKYLNYKSQTPEFFPVIFKKR